MSRNGQPPNKSTDPADYQRVPRAVAAMPKDFPDAFEIAPHSHERAQLIYATAGTMRVTAAGSMWMVPPQRALWMPAGVEHAIAMLSDVTMRTLYLRDDAAHDMRACRVRPFARLQRADRARRSADGLRRGRARRYLVALILAELHGAQSLPLHLPLPEAR